jgi:superoxide dismutase
MVDDHLFFLLFKVFMNNFFIIGGGHVNHSIFWTNLAPKNHQGGVAPGGDLAQAIKNEFGYCF